MHVRTSTKRQKEKTYRYVQIVQSYRRPDGVTAQRILGNLGALSPQAEQNLRIAIKASREGRAVIVAPDSPGLSDDSKVQANLRYLDIAVLLDVWRWWGLDELFEDIIDDGESVINYAAVISALTIQRCVAARSKFYAQRWFPTTALPEILDVPEKHFNNTRIHRVLNSLQACDSELQQRLPALYESREGVFAMTFMDVTNTYFEGRGCELAERTRTKEGHRNKRAIGIVLLANQHGYPLRWRVVHGKTKDHLAMGEMVANLFGVEWLDSTPVVLDRAMGREATVSKLLGSSLRFLTATPVNSIESHTMALPHEALSCIVLGGTDATYEKDIQLAAQAAREAGMEKVDEHLFVLDLGVQPFVASAEKKTAGKRRCVFVKERILLARKLRAELDAGTYKNQRACGEALGLTASRVSQVLRLLRLASDLQERIFECPDDFRLTEQQLKPALQERDHDRQREMLADVLPAARDALAAVTEDFDQLPAHDEQGIAPDAPRLRLVAYFNPQMYVDQHRRATEHLDGLKLFIKDLNEELASAKKSREEKATRRKIIRELEKKDYVEVFDVSLVPITVMTKTGSQVSSFRCALTLKPDVWARRHRYNGFVLLLGHPKLPHTAREIALMYRAKDAVEKDFQTIKSVIKLRPVYHHTNPKVLAHVTICMLGLLLQRTLERWLREAEVALSAPACFEILATCHLNRMKPLPGGHGLYSVTEATVAQREILDALKLSRLVDDKAVSHILTPRFVSTFLK